MTFDTKSSESASWHDVINKYGWVWHPKKQGPDRKLPVWETVDALVFCRKLEAYLSPRGFHCAMAGSVMYRGYSFKDLDLVVYTHDGNLPATPIVDAMLEMPGMVYNKLPLIDSGYKKTVLRFSYEGKRVGIIYV